MASFTRVCFYCKREFEATHSLANICAPECQKQARTSNPLRTQAIAVESEPKLVPTSREPCGIENPCVRCGKAMRDTTGRRRYCSSTCRRSMKRQARRAMLKRAFVEPVSMFRLRQRDEDRCRICGEPVNFERRPPDPSAATIDHVIALSKGGEHSYGNTQLAHLRCNTAKGSG
jgi:5-methylcytosine-specific restriction endonuclease McrA